MPLILMKSGISQLFCAHLEAKGCSCDSVRLVLRNFFECMCSQHAGSNDASSARTLEPNFAPPDTKALETVACRAENFSHNTMVAALLPHNKAILEFAQSQIDTFK
jgi:hypothetical protein